MNDDDNYNDEHDPHKIMHSHLSCCEKWIYVLVAMMMALVFSLLLSSCTIVRYDAQPGQGTTVSIWSLGSDKALSGFTASIDPKGDRKLSINGFDENQTEGMKQANIGLQMLVEGIVKGAVAGAK